MRKDFNVYQWRRDNLTENQSPGMITKSLKDVVWDDVKGLDVPTMTASSMLKMDDRNIFDDKWREDTLNNWKKQFKDQNITVVIDRSKPMWFEKVTIDNKEYQDNMNMVKDKLASDYDKNRDGYPGD